MKNNNVTTKKPSELIKKYTNEEAITLHKKAVSGYGNQFSIFPIVDNLIDNPSEFHDPDTMKLIIENYKKIQNLLTEIEVVSNIPRLERTSKEANITINWVNSLKTLLQEINKNIIDLLQIEVDLKAKAAKEQKKIDKLNQVQKIDFQRGFNLFPYEEFKQSCEKFLMLLEKEFDNIKELIDIIDYQRFKHYNGFNQSANESFYKLKKVVTLISEKGVASRDERSEIHTLIRQTQKQINRLNEMLIMSI